MTQTFTGPDGYEEREPDYWFPLPPLCGPLVPGAVNGAARRIRACGPGSATAEDLQIVKAFQLWLGGDRTVWNNQGVPVCPHCGRTVDEQPDRRDIRHDHCGPLPHTGAASNSSCEACG